MPVAVTVTAMRDPEEEVVGYIVIAENITRRRIERARTRAIIASQTDIAAAGLEVSVVMERIAARALTVTGASGAVIETLDGGEMLYAIATGSLAPFAHMRVARGGSLSGRCLGEGRIIYSEDTENDAGMRTPTATPRSAALTSASSRTQSPRLAQTR